MDRLNSQQRHANMVAIHGKDTKTEMVVRRWLWGHGYRYRLNHPLLPGKPDIVMRKYRTCIFVNGCFWHGHNVSLTPTPSPKGEGSKEIENSECCKILKTNREFWVAKIRRNLLLNFSTQAQNDDLQDHSIRRHEELEEEPLMAAEDVSTEYGNKAT